MGDVGELLTIKLAGLVGGVWHALPNKVSCLSICVCVHVYVLRKNEREGERQ